MSYLTNALLKEQFKHQLFPILLLLHEELPTWKARADCLNTAGLTTYHKKAWTPQNVNMFWNAYWSNPEQRYSWFDHKINLTSIAAILT
jgi:hypothetical protein